MSTTGPTDSTDGIRFEGDKDDGRQRLLLELEFVQLLANPTYIHYLAQNRYFEDQSFVNYLSYLQYWQQPEYAKLIMYPHALFFLEMLQDAHFRASMAHQEHKELAHRQQFYFWQHFQNNRLQALQESARAAPPFDLSADQRLTGTAAAGEVPSHLPIAIGAAAAPGGVRDVGIAPSVSDPTLAPLLVKKTGGGEATGTGVGGGDRGGGGEGAQEAAGPVPGQAC
eukprot:TRINITY_DN5617_c0_g2_i1.p1 TRINITY_DN5617_c0_g2~~TRINITY_DN5617_c0_g2_i1.p1  ORF type:complete len:225 (-),score=42.78 TRINITY_DN5617_c0_g2_i1:614-1288(-)